MRNLYLCLMLLLFSQISFAQVDSLQGEKSYWAFSVRVGYDFPDYDNETPYIDYKGGIMGGISIDKYWNWFGLGLDFDFIRNKPENIFPTINLLDASSTSLSNFNLTEEKISRIFFGIGPDLKYQNKNRKFVAELNSRFGLGYIKGGRTLLANNTVGPLNFHAGYDDFAFSAKGQLKFNYYFNPNFGIHIGGYYLRHFGVEERSESGISAMYEPFTETGGVSVLNGLGAFERQEACHCDISSVGIFVGITYKINSKKKEECSTCIYCNVCGKTHQPPVCPCSTCPVETYAITVTAKDKYSNELLPGTSVALKNAAGEVIYTGVTNEFGVVNFTDVLPDNYSIEGILHTVNLEGSSVAKDEFIPNGTVQKIILYGDMNFIIKGKAFECNTNKPLSGTSVYLNGVDQNYTKTTITDDNGDFILHLPQLGRYDLHAKKLSYMSNIEQIDASNYNRERSLFVNLEICAREVNCETIRLDNIHYDLDKFFIRPDAMPELYKVVRFLTDNPDVKIEISSHTDSRASHAYNQKLSQNRANAAIEFIISNGIDRNRLVGVGYGETRLLNRCADGVNCSEEEHQLNRRTEMRVLCP